MKKIIIVNNNMKVGGVQKSLCNLLWSISEMYDITLLLFSATEEYAGQLPESVKVATCDSLFRYLGVSQGECSGNLRDRLPRGLLASLCKAFGRPSAIRIMSLSQRTLPEEYDVAISYLQNGRLRSFYGGVNEFVLRKVKAKRKIAFLHCDYGNCGANCGPNNRLYAEFDGIAACSDGCRRAFVRAIPKLEGRCFTVRNFHRPKAIRDMAASDPVEYEAGRFHALVVGRLAHEKAVDRAIRAVAFGIESNLPVSLHIVGGGGMAERLEELAAELGIEDAVHFHGNQRNPYRFMANADLLLVTSYHEAAPMVIDEARIVGLPVLTVETTSSKEMVLDRRCGWVCENSQEGINRQLAKVLSDPPLLKEAKSALGGVAIDNEEAFGQFRTMIEMVEGDEARAEF